MNVSVVGCGYLRILVSNWHVLDVPTYLRSLSFIYERGMLYVEAYQKTSYQFLFSPLIYINLFIDTPDPLAVALAST